MSKLKFGEAFALHGIDNMGRRGAPWLTVDVNGLLVLMAHQNYFKMIDGQLFYIEAGGEGDSSSTSMRNHKIMRDYLEWSTDIKLIVGIFKRDNNPSQFDHSDGTAYIGEIVEFDPDHWRFKIKCRKKL